MLRLASHLLFSRQTLGAWPLGAGRNALGLVVHRRGDEQAETPSRRSSPGQVAGADSLVDITPTPATYILGSRNFFL